MGSHDNGVERLNCFLLSSLLYAILFCGNFKFRGKDRLCHETRKDFENEETSEHGEEGRLRRVPDILPVCLQDILHCRKSKLRAQITRVN